MQSLKLVLNPFAPNYQQLGDLSVMVHAPYINSGMTIQGAPKLGDVLLDAAHPEAHIRRVLVSFMEANTPEYAFDLEQDNSHTICIKNQYYEVTLKDIGEEEIPQIKSRKFLYFMFDIEKVAPPSMN